MFGLRRFDSDINILIRFLLFIFRSCRRPALLLIALNIVCGAMTPISVYIWFKIVDVGFNIIQLHAEWTNLFPFVLGLIVVSLVANLKGSLEQLLVIAMRHRLRTTLLPLIANKMTLLPFTHLDDPKVLNLISRIGEQTENRLAEGYKLITDIPGQFTIALGLAFLFLQGGPWVLFLVSLLCIPAIWLGIRQIREAYTVDYNLQMEIRRVSYISSLFIDKASLKEIHLYDLSDYLIKKVHKTSCKVANIRLSLIKKQLRRGFCLQVAEMALTCGAVIAFALSMHHGNLSCGEFIALCSALPALIAAIVYDLPEPVSRLKEQALYWKEVEDILQLPEIPLDTEPYNSFQDVSEITFKNVHFAYPGTSEEILKGINFTIKKGDNVAIVGLNGSGKSTIVKLMLGLYKPTLGEITVNGLDISTLGIATRRRLCSAVFQDFYCYYLSVRENIGLGRVEQMNDDDAISLAAKKGMSNSFIDKLPAGYETLLGQVYVDGTDISLGQWQRLAISRAGMASAAITVLDEPASAIDPLTEVKLYEAFLRNNLNDTSVIISHRMGSISKAHKILVIKDGVIAEMGTHQELMTAAGTYKRIYESQLQWYRR